MARRVPTLATHKVGYAYFDTPSYWSAQSQMLPIDRAPVMTGYAANKKRGTHVWMRPLRMDMCVRLLLDDDLAHLCASLDYHQAVRCICADAAAVDGVVFGSGLRRGDIVDAGVVAVCQLDVVYIEVVP